MLLLKRTMLLPILCIITTTVIAQTQKPAAFASFSNSIDFSESALSNAIQKTKGQVVSLQLGEEFNFSGEVMSNESVYDNLQTIIIKSSNYNNAIMQISKVINEDNSIAYVGRIFSQGGSDGYEIKKVANESYQLNKFQKEEILQDCNLK